MLEKLSFLLVVVVVLLYGAPSTGAQRQPYSLQAAVDELHRREAAKYPLNAPPSQQHFFGASPDQDYWDEDTTAFLGNGNGPKYPNRHRLNKALAKYLERENYEAEHGRLSLGPFGIYEFDDGNINDDGSTVGRGRGRVRGLGRGVNDGNGNGDGLVVGVGDGDGDGDGIGELGSNGRSNNFMSNLYPEEKKRSSYFRERDNKYENVPASVFRERESQVTSGPDHAELAEQFLREIEETQEHEREQRYKEALRNLWEKYQQQENEIEGDLFEEKKRMRTPPYYMLMAKKRSYPVLPWLPYGVDRKKRFPVAKRSTKRAAGESMSFGKTDDKVAQELSELFGTPIEEKKKRSTEEQDKVATTHAPDTAATAMSDMRLEVPEKKSNDSDEDDASTTVATHATNHHEHEGHVHAADHGHDHEHEHDRSQHTSHSQKEHKHRKRSDNEEPKRRSDNEESYEEEEDESEENDGHDEHDEHEEEEDEHDDFDDDEEERKKKRDVAVRKRSAGELFQQGQLFSANVNDPRHKKPIDWSKYFGLDRKKRAYKRNSKLSIDMKKRNALDYDDCDVDEDEKKRKRDLDPEKLDNMDKKLQSIEDFIIDETIKYTGAHEGISKPEEIRRLKDHVLSRLATAYSLEKMRRALDKLRQSVENENHLLRNVIESEAGSDRNDDVEKQKRLSVKKEKAQSEENGLGRLSEQERKTKEMHSNAMMSAAGEMHHKDTDLNNDNENGDDMKKKKKRNGYLRYPDLPNEFTDIEEELGAGHYEALNDAYLGNKNYIFGSNQCPIIEAMADRCRGVDLLSGDLNQELLPICGIHQICYLCGTTQVACDYQYLAEADSICGNNNDCQAAARSVLMILRGTPGPQIGPRECLKNSCLYSAMREIGL